MLKMILQLFMGPKHKNTNQISYKVIALVIEITVDKVFMERYLYELTTTF